MYIVPKAIDMLRESLIAKKKRPVLRLATGSGKTLIATKIIANAQAKGKRVLFVVDAVELIARSNGLIDDHHARSLMNWYGLQAD